MPTHPSYDRDARREYQRKYRAAGKDKGVIAGRNKTARFQGFDGEGGDLETGYHSYFLCSSGRLGIVPDSGNVRLSTRQCLDFIANLDPKILHVVYFGDYDFTKIVEDLPFPKLERLMNRKLRTRKDGKGVMPVSYDQYEIDYLPRKEFKVRKGNKPWVVISDVGPFFQCRFTEALEQWDIGTPEERELIARGKELRGKFEYAEIHEISRYNALEIRLLEKLMDKFRAACIEVDVIPARWQGPGQLAEALFAKYGVPKSKEVPLLNDTRYSGLLEFARGSFYGGRPEIGVIGPCDFPVYQWDLNSAYPYAMTKVPCLMHGEWVHGVSEDADGSECAIRFGSFFPKSLSDDVPTQRAPQYYGLPVRDKHGNISYPGEGRGWYWSHEIDAAIHQTFITEEVWSYIRTCDCQPLAFVEDVYQERLRMGKEGAGIVLKLALNSLYGKTVQSIGSPKYANPIWGSFITSYCRAMIQQFMHSSPVCPMWCGSDVLMIATDSVCTTTERTDLRSTKILGGWSLETHPRGIFIVQPGLYFGTSGKRNKSRGVPREVIEKRENDFRAAFQLMTLTRRLESGDVRVSQQMFVGVRYALHRKNTKLLGQWISFVDQETGLEGKRITFDWGTKRALAPVIEPGVISDTQTYLLTFPRSGDSSVCSIPYSKDIGGVALAEQIRSLYEAQPDWGEDIASGFVDGR